MKEHVGNKPYGAVLAVDYPGPHARTQLKNLRLEDKGWPVRYLLREVLPRKMTATEYAAELYSSCRLCDVDVAVIVGYCAAGEIARELASMCTAATEPPPLVLINPERAVDYDITRSIEAILRRPLSTADGTRPVHPDEWTLATFEDLEQELVQMFIDKLGDTAGSTARDLSQMQTTWAIHLAATSRTTLLPSAAELHLISSDHPCPDSCPAEHVTVCADAADVCATPAVVEAIQARRLSGLVGCPTISVERRHDVRNPAARQGRDA